MDDSQFEPNPGHSFRWPESLLIDTINTAYQRDSGVRDTLPAARLHARFLQELIDGEVRSAALLRLELIVCCAGRNIGNQAIEIADIAGFRELTDFVAMRYRNSPRMRLELIRRLRDALSRLPPRVERAPRPAAIHLLADARRIAAQQATKDDRQRRAG